METQKQKKIDLRSLYRDPSFEGSLGGRLRFYRAVKKIHPSITQAEIDEYLKTDDGYTLHKPAKKPRAFRRVFTKRIGYLYQIDLVDMSELKNQNEGFRWIIVCIDTFSKKLWCFKTKDKSAETTTDALRDLLTVNRPEKIQTDEGSEFINEKFKALCKSLKIILYTTHDEKKAVIVERVNRTLKTRMYRYFTTRGTKVWHDILDDLVDGYNKSYHSSIKCAPIDVNKTNESKIRRILFPQKKSRRQVKKDLTTKRKASAAHRVQRVKLFKIGDSVRVSRKKHVFEKGYEQTWTHEVYYIYKRNKVKNKLTVPVTYGLKDYNHEVIKGSFYPEELQLVDKSNNIWPVEKILQMRKNGKNIQFLVKWKGYSDQFNSWISDAEMFDI